MNDFVSIVENRRSANKFIKGVQLPTEELEEIFKLVKLSPSAFNLQHAHYIVVNDRDTIEKLYAAAYKQYKVLTASAVVFVLGNLEAYKDVARINEGFLNLGVLSKQEYDMEVQSVTSFYENGGPQFMRDEAIRNSSLSAQLFMLVAKDRGWDTCPMIGFNPDAVQELLNIPDNYIPTMMITIGKSDPSSQRPRGYRKPVGEFVSYNEFGKQ